MKRQAYITIDTQKVWALLGQGESLRGIWKLFYSQNCCYLTFTQKAEEQLRADGYTFKEPLKGCDRAVKASGLVDELNQPATGATTILNRSGVPVGVLLSVDAYEEMRDGKQN